MIYYYYNLGGSICRRLCEDLQSNGMSMMASLSGQMVQSKWCFGEKCK